MCPDTEELLFDLFEAGFSPKILTSSLSILSLVFEIEAHATPKGFALAAQTRARFAHDIGFRERMLLAVMNVGEILQPYDRAPPRIDVTRTLDDARRDLGIAGVAA